MAAKPLPPVEYLRQCFTYDPTTGVLTWSADRPREHFRTEARWRGWISCYGGRAAGYFDWAGAGYIGLCVGGKRFWSHRVIWKMQTGCDPISGIDHRNGNKTDNRWRNLREATQQQNLWNLPTKRGRLPTGVYVRRSGHYSVKAGKVYLGTFDTAKKAGEAYRSYVKRTRGEFAATR